MVSPFTLLRYDDETNVILNQAYEKKTPIVPLHHGYFGDAGGYTIDFSQVNFLL